MPNHKPNHNDDEPVEFKVVDRRKFTADGAPRPDADPEPPAAPAPPVPLAAPVISAPAAEPAARSAEAPPGAKVEQPLAPPAAAPTFAPTDATASPASLPPEAGPVGGPGGPGGPVQFEHLVMSLVTQAMLQLGLAARPGDLAPKPDLAAAHETIDILGVLDQKTKGNLTPHEDQLLSGSLGELRLAYVEITRRSAGRIN